VKRYAVAATLAAAALAALPAFGGAAAKSPRITTFKTAGRVVHLGADGRLVAAGTVNVPGHLCDRVVVWNAQTGGHFRWKTGSGCPNNPSGGSGLDQVAIAGRRVAWLDWGAGNLKYPELFVETIGKKPRSPIDDAINGEVAWGARAGGDFIAGLYGDGSLFAYSSWRQHGFYGTSWWPDNCDARPPDPGCSLPPGTKDEQELRVSTPSTAKYATVRTDPDTVQVTAVDSGRIAAQHEDGTISVFLANGTPLSSIRPVAGSQNGVALSGNRLAVLRSTTLAVYGASTGVLQNAALLPSSSVSSKLVDLVQTYAVYLRGRSVHVLDVRNGKDVAYTVRGSRPVDAQLERAGGLWYAYNRSGTAPGRIVNVPWRRLIARFASHQ
jgi:hypothetical protein